MAVECALKIEAYGTSGLDLIFQHGLEGMSLQLCGGQEELVAAASAGMGFIWVAHRGGRRCVDFDSSAKHPIREFSQLASSVRQGL
jgi:hypothetical protein